MRLVFTILVALLISLNAAAQEEARLPRSREEISLSFAPIIKKTGPAVVSIYTSARVRQRAISPFMDDPLFREFFGGALPYGLTQERVRNALGSGVIVDASGLIVTNSHVVRGAEQITVVLADKREFKASLAVSDPRSDLAVLRIEGRGERFPTLALKDSDEVQVGDVVLAIGNPFGVGQTVSLGIVSAVARSTDVGGNDYNYFIQTDAAINPGNSGGALIDGSGNLIGIPSSIYSQDGGSLGIGFAIPSNLVRTVIASAGSGGQIVRGWLGFTGQSLDTALAKSLGLPRPTGVIVNSIHADGPAADAGIQTGDVITAVEGKEIGDAEALRFRIATAPVKSTLRLSVLRKGEAREVPVRVIAPPENPPRNETVLKGKQPLAGASIANLSPALSQDMGFSDDAEGVVILGTRPGTPASRLGLQRGDILLQVNKHAVDSVGDAKRALESSSGPWQLAIRRGDDTINVVVR